ncbi:hypothetical protein Q3V30_22420 (plasmid) [Erwinia pyri]|uniref:Uncharacterized protein n=1 Tax=Erwinia pyri TaxID=3062598 RepID=A0AA50DNT6_9GAMM|nr:hypothetical protein [Erwinia sp. DE2]WLS81220.1 hypothetical protein Q3V30_22420 [Erwinia sp. DE2]
MKTNRLLLVPLLLSLISAPVFAKKHNHTDGLDQTGDPCEVLTCMTGKLQGDMQAGCQPVNQRFFNVRVFTPYYNPEATARLRQTILNTCEGAVINKDNLEMVIERYGRSFQE